MRYLLVNGACCCIQVCCKEISETAYKLIGRISFIKLMYTVIYFSFIGIAFFSMYLLRQWEFFMKYFADGISCFNITKEFDCVSAAVIYRIMLALFFFSFIMIIIMLISSARVATIINEGLFFSKFVLITILFLVTLQLSDNIINIFEETSQIFSYVFMIWQVIIIIDLAYLWGIKWALKYSEGSNCHGLLLIIFTIINYVLAIGIIIYGYLLSGSSSDSTSGSSSDSTSTCINYPNILSTVFLVLLFGIQLLNYNKQNSLLATSALTIFNAYWFLSGIFSNRQCNNYIMISTTNTVIGKSQFLKINIGISLFFVILSTFGSIYGSTNKQNQSDLNFIQLEDKINQPKQKKEETLALLTSEKKLWLNWHVFMLSMSLYVSMVLTDWGSGDILNGKFILTPNSSYSKIFMPCVTFVIYSWTLLAPKFFPNRNFYYQ